jgi:hypothetical protein
MFEPEKPTPNEPDPEIAQIGDDLINGAPVSSVDPEKASDVNLYLRYYKRQMLNKGRPDYEIAQRIDDICAELLLLHNEKAYCGYKGGEICFLREKLRKAKGMLRNCLREREECRRFFEEERAAALEALRQQHEDEIRQHDEEHSQPPPQKYHHVSAAVLQIREQERFLMQSKQYLQAKELREEGDALEKYDLELQRLRWETDAKNARDALLQRQKQQIICLTEKYERKWMSMVPENLMRERHWREVIEHLKKELKREKDDSKEVRTTTRELLTSCRERGLPKLGRTVQTSPLRRVTTVNNQRNYTRNIRTRSSMR